MLPKGDDARKPYESLIHDFPQTQTDPVVVVARPVKGRMTDSDNLMQLRAVVDSAGRLAIGVRVERIFDLMPAGNAASAGDLSGLLAVSDRPLCPTCMGT